MQSVNLLTVNLDSAFTTVEDSRKRLVTISENMNSLSDKFSLLMQKFQQQKADDSTFISKKLQEFKDEKMKICIGVCVGSVLLGPFVIPICAACIATNYGGLIPKYTKQLKDELNANCRNFNGFIVAFEKYKKAAMDIKKETQSEIMSLDEWKTSITQMRNRLAQYTNMIELIPSYQAKIRELVVSIKVASLKLQKRFSDTKGTDLNELKVVASIQ